nr:MAG TPA: Methylxanthine N3-demethylase NdmB [Caudoviricetes sp.]
MMDDFGHLYVNENHYHLVGPPGGGAATGRRTRGKRLVFIFHSHHHHAHRLLIFQMSDFQ